VSVIALILILRLPLRPVREYAIPAWVFGGERIAKILGRRGFPDFVSKSVVDCARRKLRSMGRNRLHQDELAPLTSGHHYPTRCGDVGPRPVRGVYRLVSTGDTGSSPRRGPEQDRARLEVVPGPDSVTQ
jgi:hypothetical protein